MSSGESIFLTIGLDAASIGRELGRQVGKANQAGKEISASMGKAFDKVRKDARKATTTMVQRWDHAVDRMKQGANKVGKALGPISAAALAAGAGMKMLGDEAFGTVDAMNTMAQASGLSMETINGLRRAALNANKDVSEIMPKDLAKRIFETSIGTGEAVLAFEALDIAAVDASGGLRSADEVLLEALDKLQRIEDPTARAAVSVKLLGEEGKNMLSAFDNADGLRDAIEQAGEFGFRSGPAAVAASNAWWKATSNITVALEDAGQALIDSYGPTAVEYMNGFAVGAIYITGLVQEFASGLGQVARMWKAIFDLDFEEASLRSRLAVQEFESSFETAEAKARIFWEQNVKGTEAANPALEETKEELEEIRINYGEVMNAAELYNQTVRGKLKPSLEETKVVSEEFLVKGTELTDDLGAAFANITFNELPELKKGLQVTLDDVKEVASAILDVFGDVTSAVQTFATLALEETVRSATEAMEQAEASGAMSEAMLAEIEADQAERIQREFKRSQDIQRVLAVIDAARAAVALIPAFAILGPGAPLAAAAVAGAGLAAQLAVINAQQPPSFPTGGVISTGGASANHQLAYFEPGEGVASRRAMSMPGFAEALEAANRGSAAMPGRVEVGLQVRYDSGARRLRLVQDRRVGKRPQLRGGR